jgi:hypothetical protein
LFLIRDQITIAPYKNRLSLPFTSIVPFSPNKLVNNAANVLQSFKGTSGLISVSGIIFDFQAYRDKLADTNSILQKTELDRMTGQLKDTLMAISRKSNSRYFDEGRRKIKRKLIKRLGKAWNTSAVMVTLTYDPKRFTIIQAWIRFNKDVAAFMKVLNQYLRRANGKKGNKYRNIGYLRVVEPTPHFREVEIKDRDIKSDDIIVEKYGKKFKLVTNKAVGYPHIHIVFPFQHYLVRYQKINEWRSHGFTQVKAYDNVDIVSYITKYVTKMKGWNDFELAIIWFLRKRIYSYSQRYQLPDYSQKVVKEWQYWGTLSNVGLKTVVLNKLVLGQSGASPP